MRLPKRILLVDDDVDTLNSIGEALRVLAGADVVTADSGAKALAKLKESKVDAMVTDYRMPGMDGIQLTTNARNKIPRLPVVMITAFNEEGLRDQALDAGVCEVVPKPVELGELVGVIDECCTAAGA